jgi:hypothetical protein
MGENGSHQGVRALPPDQSHEYFLELCALLTSGALTPEEWQQLQEHLAGCAGCREAERQYGAVIKNTIPGLAPEAGAEDAPGRHRTWSPEIAEAELLRRLDLEEKAGSPEPVTRPVSIYRGGPWAYRGSAWARRATAAAVLVASCGLGYWAGVYRGSRMGHPSQSAKLVGTEQPDPSPLQTSPAALPVRPTEKRYDHSQLPAQLRAASSEAGELRKQKAQLEQRLREESGDLERAAAERTDLDKRLAVTQANLDTLKSKLDQSSSQTARESAQSVEQQTRINELSASLHDREQKITQDEQLLDHDRDIRNLMGARDLYIAEIYDVAKTGDTQKPFGRVFYTKGKSLVFYAYDLDRQPGLKRASTFQAWGRTGSDSKHARNLGIFYQDEINKQRWILKSDDARTLSQIDAVFVTVEPNGESTKPSGKPLLFTYLRMTPNHP